ncbi:conserved hypothetical protein [Desulfamplus magnetovallimortis]|uniref:Cyclic nucleotide-binding domain-containing protein n=1 Tax=Desulfamplus magnetovallimortis TaxID=1246637 RepID=A0A1W1H748_9BACT|nr:cyclic nucleotide-binding domain-containing protein [Desulfamplus magnetovallimortis]SLM28302.1 conserved hypothetical protein [Desulfamplus magnetovallimortis]
MKNSDDKYKKLFASEYEILEKNRAALDGEPLEYKTLFENYKKLHKNYRSLLKSASRMTKMSDISQEKLNKEFKRLLRIEKIKVSAGLYWVSIPEANVYIQCGCPADSVKHLIKKGLIVKRESQGVSFESGPNVILLSDVSIQNGHLANLAEFPVLQMLYRQGMILPGHPNNLGIRPLLIGSEDQIMAQSGYIFRGNYGLINREEIMAAGISSEMADELMRLKMKFAFGQIKTTDAFIETRILKEKPVEIRNEVFIERTGLNNFLITWRGKTVTINLNLEENEEYECPYQLGIHTYQKNYFSVIHTGEGDGWDVNRPCMSSILIHQGRIFLIDAGPNIMASLISLGISIDEIEGIFHTHGHDDHFSGLTTLIRSGHRLKYFATQLVRTSVMKKMAILMSIEESHFEDFFDIIDLEPDQWNNVGGLEIRPVLSPHPIETNIFFFRAMGNLGHKIYGHFADTISFDALDGMVTENPSKNGLSPSFAQSVKERYLLPVDLKKLDVAGGLIHGKAVDFKDDRSQKIVLSHMERELTDEEKIIGSSAYFGMQSILIEGRKDYFMQYLNDYLKSYFPSVPSHSMEMLVNCPMVAIDAGDIFIHNGTPSDQVYLIVEGLAEYFDPLKKLKNKLAAGSFIGMMAGLAGEPYSGTYRAVSCLKTLQIPAAIYLEFVRQNQLYEDLKQIYEKIKFFQGTSLLGEIVSFPLQNIVARSMRQKQVEKDAEIIPENGCLMMVAKGSAHLFLKDIKIIRLNNGDYFGEDSVLFGHNSRYTAQAIETTLLYIIEQQYLKDIPIVRWKMLEAYNKRIYKIPSIF